MTPNDDDSHQRDGAGQVAARFVAVLLATLALVPVGAHLAELPSTMELAQASGFTVQGVDRGQALDADQRPVGPGKPERVQPG